MDRNYGIAISSTEMGSGKARESDTLRELEILEKEMEGLNQALGHLVHRIEPICRPAMPSPAGTNAGQTDRIIAPLASRIQGFRRRLCDLRESILSVNDRLDL